MDSLNLKNENFKVYRDGLKDGIPIALGYFAVAFSLGIAASNAGLSAFQGFVASFLTAASAGEYAGFNVIAEHGPYIEMVIMTIVASSRYLLMSAAFSQRISEKTKFGHRLGLGLYLTDEIFAISIARKGYINPLYNYGAASIAVPAWSLGTMLGIIMGNILPASVVTALGVSLYGMFLAIIIPPAKENRIILGVVLGSFAASLALRFAPFAMSWSSGTKIIILTVAIASIASVLFPVEEDQNEQ